jgi:hypothetical protein
MTLSKSQKKDNQCKELLRRLNWLGVSTSNIEKDELKKLTMKTLGKINTELAKTMEVYKEEMSKIQKNILKCRDEVIKEIKKGSK